MRGTLVSFFAWFEKPCREEIDRCLACCRCFVRWVVSPFNSLAHVRSWFWCAVVDVVDALARVLPVFRVCMYAGGDAIVLLNFSLPPLHALTFCTPGVSLAWQTLRLCAAPGRARSSLLPFGLWTIVAWLALSVKQGQGASR